MIEALNADASGSLEHEQLEIWTRTAGTYITSAEGLTGQASGALLDAAGVHEGTALLDIGTGPGTVVGPALDRGAVVHAIDVTPAMIEQARRRYPQIDARVANASSLPFPDQSFDAVTLPFRLHHMAEPMKALAEAHRTLRPGGRVALTVWAPDDRLEAFGLGFGALGALQIELTPPRATPLDGAEPSIYPQLLEAAGFDALEVQELDIRWDLRDSTPLADLLARFLGLDTYGADVPAAYASAVDAAVRERTARVGNSSVPNPAVLVAGRRTN